jgi:hypothetical protein
MRVPTHPLADHDASEVADGYAVVVKLYDRETYSEEARTAALMGIEGQLSLIAHCLRAIADNASADLSSAPMLGTAKDHEHDAMPASPFGS